MSGGWTVASDQSTAASYKASDLHVGKISSTAFAMKHRMGLAVINLKDKNIVTEKKYLDKSGNTYNYVWTSNATTLSAHSSRTFTSTAKPYGGSSTGYSYYYIVKNSTNTSFSASNENTYPNADVPNNSWTENNVNIASGVYKQYDKDSGITTSILSQYSVAIGDILYANGAISSTYTSSLGTPVGIIFYTDPTTYDRNLGYTHGYAMALTFASSTTRTTFAWCSGTYATQVATDGLLTPRATTNGKADVGDIITTGLLQTGETEEQYRRRAIFNDMDGLKHCNTALEKDYNNMTAILKAKSHDTYTGITKTSTTTTVGSVTLISPKTSGWYLPSTGHFYHWLKMGVSEITGSESWLYRSAVSAYYTNESLGNGGDTDCVGSNLTKDFYMNRNTYKDATYTTTSRMFLHEMNVFLDGKGLSGKYCTFGTSFHSWTSTENYANVAFGLNLDGNEIYMCDGRQGWGVKGTNMWPVWPVLAF